MQKIADPEWTRLSAPRSPDSAARESDNESSEPWSLSAAGEAPEEPFTIAPALPVEEKRIDEPPPPSLPPAAADATPPGPEIGDIIFPMEPFRDQPASTVPYLSLCGLLVIFFFLATAYLEAHPKVSEALVGKIPLIGPAVIRNSNLKNGVLLKSLRAVYQTIQGNREVLVVSGEAVNQNPVMPINVPLLVKRKMRRR